MDFRVERFFFQIIRPFNLLNGILFYALGVGISRYLGSPVIWGLVIIGQIWVTTFQLGMHLLTTFFHYPPVPEIGFRYQPREKNQLNISGEI